MSTPIPSNSYQVINQIIDQVASGKVNGLKQLSQAERKILKTSLEQLVSTQDKNVKLDSKIANKISSPENYHKNFIRSLIKGIAKRLFKDYIDTASLVKFINDNASTIRQNVAQTISPLPLDQQLNKASAIGKATAPVDEIKTVSTITSAPAISTTNISKLDTDYEDILSIAKSLTAFFPPTIPAISFSETEKANLPKARETLSNLEKHLYDKYGNDFTKAGWHGRLSFQRILWQDEKFVLAIQNPLVIKLILSNAFDKVEADLGGGNSISNLLLYGLGSNRLSYLVSAAPNWDNKPNGISWNHLEDMRLDRHDPETPWKITSEYIKDIQTGLDNIRTVFTSAGVQVPDNKLASVYDQINNASISELIDAFNALINSNYKIYCLTYSAAGESTLPNRMAGQCFEVMASYNDALALNNGDHTAALGYGLVSHALDAKHLAAALYVESKKGQYYDQIVARYGVTSPVFNGVNTLRELLKNAREGKLDAETTDLLKIRLQQIITLLIDNPKIGPTIQDISSALTAIKA